METAWFWLNKLKVLVTPLHVSLTKITLKLIYFFLWFLIFNKLWAFKLSHLLHQMSNRVQNLFTWLKFLFSFWTCKILLVWVGCTCTWLVWLLLGFHFLVTFWFHKWSLRENKHQMSYWTIYINYYIENNNSNINKYQ